MTTDEEKLVLDNMNLAYDLAWKYHQKFYSKFELEELQSIALLGLTKAGKTFDINRGNKFSTYAYQCIRNEFSYYFQKNVKYINDIHLFTKIVEDLDFQSILPSDNNVEKSFLVNYLYDEIEQLKPNYKTVILKHLEGRTFNEIAELMNISQSQVSQYYAKAINILRNKFKEGR